MARLVLPVRGVYNHDTLLTQQLSRKQTTRPVNYNSSTDHSLPFIAVKQYPIKMSSVPAYRTTSASPSSSRKAVKASASASATSSRPPRSDPYYGHEETAILCARFVCLTESHLNQAYIRSPPPSNVPMSPPQWHLALQRPPSLTLSPTPCIEHGYPASSPLQHYFSSTD